MKRTELNLRQGATVFWGVAGLTCVLDGHVGQQEVLSEGAVGAKAALEGLVADMGKLVVQQRLLVLTNELAELALEPGGGRRGESSATGRGGEPQPQGPPRGCTCGWRRPGYA